MTILDTQTNIIVQNLGEWLLPIMNVFSILGVEHFQLLIISAIFWCFDRKLGARLGLTLLFASSLNSLMKIAFHLPRPYWIDADVKAYAAEPSFGFPSGHSQKAAVFWGMLGIQKKRLPSILAAVFLIGMVGTSRLYLGVHFLADVLGGWLFGLLILTCVLRLDRPISRWFEKRPSSIGFILILFTAGFMIVMGIVAKSFLQDWNIPPDWVTLSARAGTIHPVSLTGLFSGCGIFIGYAGGLFFLRNFEARSGIMIKIQGTTEQKLWRLVTGFAGLLLIYSGLGMILPRDESVIGFCARLIRFGLTGFWITGLAPLFFLRNKLISQETALRVESSLSTD